jgi:diguanylate cyclase (GGDEF)-like protein/PAS domain S-box-containing protein
VSSSVQFGIFEDRPRRVWAPSTSSSHETFGTILIADGEEANCEFLAKILKGEGHEVLVARDGDEAIACIGSKRVDLALLDVRMPGRNGFEVCRLIKMNPDTRLMPVVLVTGLINTSEHILDIECGADDYLRKPIRREELCARVRSLLRLKQFTDQLESAENVRLLAERLSLATAVAKVGVWDWELATDVHTWDATMSAIYGFLRTDPINYEKWSSSVHPEDLSDVQATLREAIDLKGEGTADFRIILADGSVRNISSAYRAVLDGSANVSRVIGVNVDISARKQAEQALLSSEARMSHLAGHDFLTGLPNRMLLNERIGQAIEFAPRNCKKLALLFLDLDGLKQINDSLGHPTGDKLIQSVGKCLTDSVRASDTVCRHSADEFIVLISEVEHLEDAAIAARRVLKAVAMAHSIDQHDLHVTGCIGISVYPVDGMDAETLIKSADTAMYQAKDDGHPGYQFFNPAMRAKAVDRQFIEENLRRALDRKELSLHYQPKINLKTRAITGAEALLRWDHPTRGSISPAQFIPVAEESGLILPIGTWVLSEACRQACAWRDSGLPEMTIAVNVSERQFQSGNFAEGLFAILLDTGLDPKFLELEITESLLMRRLESTAIILQTLREKGVNVAIDDFGTGYSSLSYLYQLPLDSLKIDQSFVRQITATPNQTGIVSAIIDMGKNLNLSIVAEGVETAEELDFLQARHCDEAQGDYFSRPVPPHQFVKLFEGTHVWNDSITPYAGV